MKIYLLVLLLAAPAHLLLSAANGDESDPARVFLPADAGMLNVREHGLKGDGVSDDTAALRKLVRANLNQHKTLYFPAGVYLLSDSIPWATDKGVFWPWLTWQGAGRGQTTIRLADKAAGFGDPAKPKALIKTGCYDGESRQNAAFNCYLFDLTIHTGRGNAGTIGLDYCSNNNGGVVRVDIISGDGAGVAGLSMTRDSPGPALVQQVRIRGFDTGIALAHLLFGMTFETIRLEEQRRVGMSVDGNAAAIRRLTSVNRVPALELDGWASAVVLVDSALTGGEPGTVAILKKDAPTLLLRKVRTEGYGNAVRVSAKSGETTLPGGEIEEFLSGERFALFADAAKGRTLNLPVLDAPAFFGEEGEWVSVTACGAKGDGESDDTPAVQRAIDSGKAVVYFPAGKYRLESPVVVRGSVRRIVGFSSSFTHARDRTLFRFENAASPATLERFCFFDGGKIENAAAQPVILRHITGPEKEGIVTTGSGRQWFFEDVCTSHFTLPPGTRLYARQFNCEPEPPGPGFINDGGDAWILGLKTEWGNTIAATRNKGRTEILGGLMLPAQGFKDKTAPAFIVEDAKFSATWNEITFGTGTYRAVVQEARGAITRVLKPQIEGTQRAWSLYTTEEK